MLSIEHFSKTYPGGKRAVEDLNLTIQAGEICGFIGHNGAGKTTTLRAVAGVMAYSEGTIRINGIDLHTDPVAAKKVMAFLPDNPDLYEYMKGIDYLNFIADLYEIPGDVRTRRIARYADDFQITEALGSAIGGYSHGMKQKLALTSALIRHPKLLILDEPFVGLDPQASHLLKGYLAQLCAEGGAVFFSTHVLEVAQKLCHKVAMIQNGRLIRYGTMEEIVAGSSLEDVFLRQSAGGEDHA